jgi:hypothetical protein
MGGRMAAMPAWGEILGEAGVKNVAAYVRHELAGLPLPANNKCGPASWTASVQHHLRSLSRGKRPGH